MILHPSCIWLWLMNFVFLFLYFPLFLAADWHCCASAFGQCHGLWFRPLWATAPFGVWKLLWRRGGAIYRRQGAGSALWEAPAWRTSTPTARTPLGQGRCFLPTNHIPTVPWRPTHTAGGRTQRGAGGISWWENWEISMNINMPKWIICICESWRSQHLLRIHFCSSQHCTVCILYHLLIYIKPNPSAESHDLQLFRPK